MCKYMDEIKGYRPIVYFDQNVKQVLQHVENFDEHNLAAIIRMNAGSYLDFDTVTVTRTE